LKTPDRTTLPRGEAHSDIVLRPVGIIRNAIKQPFLKAGDDGIDMRGRLEDVKSEIRKQGNETSKIIIDEEMIRILHGIDEYSHLVVLYWAHKVPEKSRRLTRVHPMGRKELPLVGIFCTCSPARPNPVLMTVVRLLKREENILHVNGLDAVDGSPVIDIKPYVESFYRRKRSKAPEWMRKLEEEFRGET
jgi:tRNA-Thr(GGU) m(6)t(6)A37 methyltransferase TsaA